MGRNGGNDSVADGEGNVTMLGEVIARLLGDGGHGDWWALTDGGR